MQKIIQVWQGERKLGSICREVRTTSVAVVGADNAVTYTKLQTTKIAGKKYTLHRFGNGYLVRVPVDVKPRGIIQEEEF